MIRYLSVKYELRNQTGPAPNQLLLSLCSPTPWLRSWSRTQPPSNTQNKCSIRFPGCTAVPPAVAEAAHDLQVSQARSVPAAGHREVGYVSMGGADHHTHSPLPG